MHYFTSTSHATSFEQVYMLQYLHQTECTTSDQETGEEHTLQGRKGGGLTTEHSSPPSAQDEARSGSISMLPYDSTLSLHCAQSFGPEIKGLVYIAKDWNSKGSPITLLVIA
jgi:hypothetical protein